MDHYLLRARALLHQLDEEQGEVIGHAGAVIVDAIAEGGMVYVFGSDHGTIPGLDIFPRYGRVAGFQPLRGRVPTWLTKEAACPQRPFGLARDRSADCFYWGTYPLTERDVVLVYVHGVSDWWPVMVALEAKKRGLTVIGVVSTPEAALNSVSQSSCTCLAGIADIVISGCDLGIHAGDDEDAPRERPVGDPSDVVIAIGMALVAEVVDQLVADGHGLGACAALNVPGVGLDFDPAIVEVYQQFIRHLDSQAS